MLKVAIETPEKRSEICSKLAIKTPEERGYDVVMVFLLLTLYILHILSTVSLVDFEQVNLSWVIFIFCRLHMYRSDHQELVVE